MLTAESVCRPRCRPCRSRSARTPLTRASSKLPISFGHAEAVATLAHHHNDPFDRMLVAQALCERLTLVTHDRRFAPYGIEVLWT